MTDPVSLLFGLTMFVLVIGLVALTVDPIGSVALLHPKE